MTFLDELMKYKQADNTTLHQVLLNVSALDKTLHIFFEGKTDESFYGNLIAKYSIKYKIMSYKAGNKKSVYYFCENLNSKKNTNNFFLFFVDKDLDDIIPIHYDTYHCLHVTQYYSIENYCVTNEMFSRVIAEIYKIGRGNGLYNMLIEKYKKEYSKFVEGMHPLMAWILFHKRQGNKIIVQNIKNSMLFSLDNDANIQIYSLESILDKLDRSTDVKTDIKDWSIKKHELVEELKKHDHKKILRGKFEAQFFTMFCKTIRQLIEAANGTVNCSFTIDTQNAIDILAPRLELPESFYKAADWAISGNVQNSVS